MNDKNQLDNKSDIKLDLELEFTGERFTPECVREIWYEHYHRYAFAKNLVKEKNILDAACGEGYGSNLLSEYAVEVTGLDIDNSSIEHAKKKYKRNNLTFVEGSCSQLPFEDDSFDVVVSFETLEHLSEQKQMLKEFKRVLNKDGILIISTPDKKHYSDATGFVNEYHVKELYKQEFKSLLDEHWKQQTWYAQAMTFNSVLEKIDSTENSYCTDILKDKTLKTNLNFLTPMYYLVVASNDSLQDLPDLHLFADEQKSVYGHYNKTIKDYIYLANKHNELLKQHEKWLSIPILGKIIKFIAKR
ncbi:MAG: class I SAM-dependent methyltransferase [Proteobacteria bacterium]|nr:class I SAM-dependent methyltransferase [Pseudomonadota bacterium]